MLTFVTLKILTKQFNIETLTNLTITDIIASTEKALFCLYTFPERNGEFEDNRLWGRFSFRKEASFSFM